MIKPGCRVGSFEILSPLGAGGMGEVFLARDTRLDRQVAIKALPEHLITDPDRLARFEREAKIVASLNHPGIAAVYALELHEGNNFLVMEYVEGETLAERLKRGRLPADEALSVAIQIAEALEAAHEKGVIHRDFKPGNVMITPDHKVKVLDFGLARTADTAGAPSAETRKAVANSPTLTSPAFADSPTIPGAILGTAGYMSPEQARGKPVDKRTDIWSFGCVLYEMLTGTRLFDGESSSDIIAKILERDPDLSGLPPRVPPRVRELLVRALEKNPRRRLRDIGDAVIELEASIANRERSASSVTDSTASPGRSRRRIATVATFAGALLLATYTGWQWRGRSSPLRVNSFAARFTQLTDQQGAESHPSLSPDGKTVVYVARDGDDLDIFSLRVGGLNPINLTKDCSRDDSQPSFSPDGTQIVFRSEREGGGLFLMGATGESPRRLTDFGYDPKWAPDGRRVAFATEGVVEPLVRVTSSTIWTVDIATGEKKKLTESDSVQPSWSPHGHRIAYWSVRRPGGQRDIYSIPSTGGEPVALTLDAATDWFPVWSPDGQYVYFCSDRGGSMNVWRIAVDKQTGRPRGACEPVTCGATLFAHPSLSADGRWMALTAATISADIERVHFDPKTESIVGAPEPVSRFNRHFTYPDLSPDGQWVACVCDDNLVLLSVNGTERRQLTSDAFKERGPRWSPDGKRLVFYSDRSGHYQIWTVNPDGSNLIQISHATGNIVDHPRWSPDGTQIVFAVDRQIGIMDPHRPWEQQTVSYYSCVEPPKGFTASSWSPDGKQIAGYVWNSESGLSEGVAVFDVNTKTLRRVSHDGHYPEFLDDGKRLVYAAENGRLMLSDIEGNPVRTLLSLTPDEIGLNGIGLARDDSAIYYSRQKTESDIWLLQLE